MDLKCKIQGTVIRRDNIKNVTDKLRKRTFIVHVPNSKDSKYDEYFEITGMNQRADLIENIRVGYTVDVEFFVTGKKWIKKETNETFYFKEFSLFALDILKAENKEEGVVDPQPVSLSDTNDLPF